MHLATPPTQLLRNVRDYCGIIAQCDPTTHVRQRRSARQMLSHCLRGPPDSRLPTRAPALKIHVLSFHLESRHLVRFPSILCPCWNPKRPPGWASRSAPKGQRTVVPFCRHRDTFVWGRWRRKGRRERERGGVTSNFLHCGSGQLYFIQQASRPPRTTLSQPPPAQ